MPKNISNEIIISSGMASISIVADDANLLNKIGKDEFLYRYLPDCSIGMKTSDKADAKIFIKRNSVFGVAINYPVIHCHQPPNADIRGLISLAGYVLERANNNKGVYSIHASVASKNNKAVVIFGGTTNLGKSIIAKTVADKYKWIFYSDETALLSSSEGRVTGGVKIASNCDKFDNFKIPETKDKPKIFAFIHPHIDNGLKSVVKWEQEKFFWHLKEELSRKIRGGSKAINNYSYPLDSLDTFDLAKNRLAFAKKFAKQVPCYEVRGTPESISKFINNLHDKLNKRVK